MFRKTTLGLLAIASLAVTASLSAPLHAGCHSGYGYGYGYRYSYPTVYARPVIQQAPPVVFADLPQEQLASVPVGSTITLPANFLGPQPGSVFLVFNNVKLPVQVINWADEGVTITLPAMALRQSLKVRLDVVLPHGQLGLQQPSDRHAAGRRDLASGRSHVAPADERRVAQRRHLQTE